MVIHPGPTVGYRVSDGVSTMAYMPDHEPALSTEGHPPAPDWTSGYDLAADADLLLHDAQYTADEYEGRMGWGTFAHRRRGWLRQDGARQAAGHVSPRSGA